MYHEILVYRKGSRLIRDLPGTAAQVPDFAALRRKIRRIPLELDRTSAKEKLDALAVGIKGVSERPMPLVDDTFRAILVSIFDWASPPVDSLLMEYPESGESTELFSLGDVYPLLSRGYAYLPVSRSNLLLSNGIEEQHLKEVLQPIENGFSLAYIPKTLRLVQSGLRSIALS